MIFDSYKYQEVCHTGIVEEHYYNMDKMGHFTQQQRKERRALVFPEEHNLTHMCWQLITF